MALCLAYALPAAHARSQVQDRRCRPDGGGRDGRELRGLRLAVPGRGAYADLALPAECPPSRGGARSAVPPVWEAGELQLAPRAGRSAGVPPRGELAHSSIVNWPGSFWTNDFRLLYRRRSGRP